MAIRKIKAVEAGQPPQRKSIAELQSQFEATFSNYTQTGDTNQKLASFDAYKDVRNAPLVHRLTLHKNVLRWHERLVAISNQHVHPGEGQAHRTQVAGAFADVVRELRAALQHHHLHDADRKFLNEPLAKHAAGASAVILWGGRLAGAVGGAALTPAAPSA
jgi:hypothetical protein